MSSVEEGKSKTDWGKIEWDDLGSTKDGRLVQAVQAPNCRYPGITCGY